MAATNTMFDEGSIQELLSHVSIDKEDAKLLMRHVLGFSRAQLITHNNYILSHKESNTFQELCLIRSQGMPINYITKTREFYSREFRVTPDTLIPRPETELLVDSVIENVTNKTSVLDMGTGSGCIAITIKLELPRLSVSAVDKSLIALNVAKFNADNLGADINLFQSDWFLNVNQKYDIIVSNPPYIHPNDHHLKNLTYEPQDALTDFNDGLSCLRTIISGARNYLNPNGILIVEHGYDQGEQVRLLFTSNGFSDIVSKLDYSNNERLTLGYLINKL